MKKVYCLLLVFVFSVQMVSGQVKQLYDVNIDPIEQIDAAVATAKNEGKYVVCQVGGNWCKWCRWFGKFVEEDADVSKVINENFVYIHVNYGKASDVKTAKVIERLKNPGRFGFPVLVVLDNDGNVIHTQASNYLEEGEGYNKKRVLDFFNLWTPKAVTTVVR